MTSPLSRDEVNRIAEKVGALGEAGDQDGAWEAVGDLRERQADDGYVARALLALVDGRAFDTEHSLEIVRDVFASHGEDDAVLGALGGALESAHDVRFLNAPPPTDPIFFEIADRLRARAGQVRGTDVEPTILSGLATAGRLFGREWDASTEAAYRRRIALRPSRWEDRYNLGLFFKVRGRFVEGLAANREAAELGGDDESVRWNLGICATGAREGGAALAVWKQLGQSIEMGRFGLPEGRYDSVKVRVAEHPLAERGRGENSPGLEETIWIERLSPCHGVIRSALFQELGVDYGDVILFDGAPITHHQYGAGHVPVFPHLVTLERPGYRRYAFVATQPSEGAVAALSKALPDDALLYSHSEQFVVLCSHCWENEQLDHRAHRKENHLVVRGKLCAPPHVSPATLRGALDAAVASAGGIRVFVPELSRELGDHARAEVETRRAHMVESS